ncbi:lactonase family protein [Mucilaginibacter sp. UR6-11]|uniref:lactonase family protein n=1 Tax=Mucilaginibacter sp. UR6-11 TaxID=1435644 RepID=UPI001E5849BB|nr:lactonase family protein [Mucilaginibacter sp. UR6-11]MCC8424625.1 lactonase family protein [Mucilaginibacter sp. UR6-11]
MKKLLFLFALISPVFCLAQKKNTGPKVFDLVIGTYTGTTPTSSKGIYIYRFYAERGEVAYLSEIETANPSYLAISQNQQYIYAVNENNEITASSVTAFKFNKNSGKIEQLNSQPSVGSPAYIAVDKAQKNVFIANYGGGSLQVFPINKDGSLGASTQTITDKGSGPDQMRQAQPHVHSAMLTPDEKYLITTDLGTDKINIYRYHASKIPPLTPATIPFISTAGGSGPRHNDFAPNGKFMYNIQEMAASITAYAYNDGELKELQTVKMMPDDFKGVNGAADIHVSPDGKYLYATNRGTANQIVVYAIDQLTGKLTFVERYKTGGENPRNFIIDPTGNYLLVGTTNRVNIFKVDKPTGRLALTRNVINMESAVCLKMTPVE